MIGYSSVLWSHIAFIFSTASSFSWEEELHFHELHVRLRCRGGCVADFLPKFPTRSRYRISKQRFWVHFDTCSVWYAWRKSSYKSRAARERSINDLASHRKAFSANFSATWNTTRLAASIAINYKRALTVEAKEGEAQRNCTLPLATCSSL